MGDHRARADAEQAPQLLSVFDLVFRWPRAPTDCIVIERFDVARGEAVFVRGPSGCGKSTLLSLLAGVLLPVEGAVRLLGDDWQQFSAAGRDRRRADHIGYIFQQFNLLPYLTAVDNVLLTCNFSPVRARRVGEHSATVRAAAKVLLGNLGLGPDTFRRCATELSVGQQQRVAAARALIGGPELVIADEPTSALDEDLRDSFMQILLDACRQAGSALVFVSHDNRLSRYFDRLVDLPALNRAGAIPAVGEPTT